MKVTAFIGSARKKHTYNAAVKFLENLQALGNIDYEIVRLSDFNLATCKGCKLCCDRGEELCPLKDDRDVLIKKMLDSDGIVFATPNYFFQVSALMKLFLDRLAYLGHRPRSFGQAFTSIVAQGMGGGDKIVKYLDFIGFMMGCNTVKGSCITTLEPITDKGRVKIERIIDRHSRRYHSTLMKKARPSPNAMRLMMFRMGRTGIRIALDDSFRDYAYYREKGWFESDFFYPVRLNVFQKLIGKVSDMLGVQWVRNR